MIPRFILAILVYCLPLFGVAFVVLIGAYALTQSAGDQTAAGALWWVAMGVLILLVTDAVLLLGALGLSSLTDWSDNDKSPPMV